MEQFFTTQLNEEDQHQHEYDNRNKLPKITTKKRSIKTKNLIEKIYKLKPEQVKKIKPSKNQSFYSAGMGRESGNTPTTGHKNSKTYLHEGVPVIP